MKILRVFENNINDRYIEEAVQALKDGHIIIYPTDSVYGLAADALNKKAVEKLCRIKGLDPEKNLLSIVCNDFSQASQYAKIDNRVFSILKNYLPGAYTFILTPSTKLPKAFKNRKTIGVRIPDNAIARRIAEQLGNPILTGSVDTENDDMEEISEPEVIAMSYQNDVAVVVDGGRGGTVQSTLVDLTDPENPVVLREGLEKF